MFDKRQIKTSHIIGSDWGTGPSVKTSVKWWLLSGGEGWEGNSHSGAWGESVSGRGNSQSKGPELGPACTEVWETGSEKWARNWLCFIPFVQACHSLSYIFFFKIIFICSFIYGCGGSLLLHTGFAFSSCDKRGATLLWCVGLLRCILMLWSTGSRVCTLSSCGTGS